MFYEWRPYVSVAERRLKAMREMAKLKGKGHPVSPVKIQGRKIASTFWGKAWCDSLERYSDFENRLPRGRTYVRNGSVVDLQIAPGEVIALVCGSQIYRVTVNITPVSQARWKAICQDCAGAIDSLVELLRGRFSTGVMGRICQHQTGLFPSPDEIKLACSCPDWAYMCKHVAAVLYAIGARLDQQPELLFRLRKVDEKDLIAKAGRRIPLAKPAAEKTLRDDSLAELFGLEMSQSEIAKTKPSDGRAKPRPKKEIATPKRTRKERKPIASAGKGKAAAASETGASSGAGKSRSRPTRPKRGASRR